jgi:hypothetical protein
MQRQSISPCPGSALLARVAARRLELEAGEQAW